MEEGHLTINQKRHTTCYLKRQTSRGILSTNKAGESIRVHDRILKIRLSDGGVDKQSVHCNTFYY